MSRTPYLGYLQECLQHAEDSRLFEKEALEVSAACVKLPELSQCLLARLLLRTGEWHRSDRLVNCMPRDLLKSSSEEGSLAQTGLQEAMKGLVSTGYMEVLCDEHSFDEAWTALTECFFADEVKKVHFNVCKVKAKGDKPEVLNSLYKAVKTSRNLFNRPISLFRQMKSVLYTSNSICFKLVRLTPRVLRSLRRMQRIMQMSCATGDVSSGRSCFSVTRPLHFNAAMLNIIGKIRYPLYDIVTEVSVFPSDRSFRMWEAANELRVCFDEVLSIINKKGSDPLTHFLLEPSPPSCSMGLELALLKPLHRIWVANLCAKVVKACASFDIYEGNSPMKDESLCSAIDLTLSDGDDDEEEIIHVWPSPQKRNDLCKPSVVIGRLLQVEMSNTDKVMLQNECDMIAVKGAGFSFLSFLTIGAISCLMSYLEMHSADKNGDLSQKLPFLNQLDAGNILSAMGFDGIEIMEKEIREIKGGARQAVCSVEDIHGEENCDEALSNINCQQNETLKTLSCKMSRRVSDSVFGLPSFSFPIQILRLLIYGDYKSDSNMAYTNEKNCPTNDLGDLTTNETRRTEMLRYIRRYCPRRVGKMIERLCIDLEHEGRPDWSLLEAQKGLKDADVLSSYCLGLNKRLGRLQKSLKKQKRIDSSVYLPSLIATMNTICYGIKTPRGQSKRRSSPPPKSRKECTHEVDSTDNIYCVREEKSTGDNIAKSTWSCPKCTLLNSTKYWKCTLCSADRVSISPSVLKPSSAIASIQSKDYGQDPNVDNFEEEALSSKINESNEHEIKNDHERNGAIILAGSSDMCGDEATGHKEVKDIIKNNIRSTKGYTQSTASFTTKRSESYCTTPMTERHMKEILFNNLHTEYTAQSFDDPSRTVVISGRRLGNLRPGKNKLIGVTGDAVSVEKLVMQTMEHEYEEEIVSFLVNERVNNAALENNEFEQDIVNRRVKELEHFCGGWIGWHCEGSLLRSIFGLMMWTEIFPYTSSTSVENNPMAADLCSRNAPLYSCQPVADVFRTPFQDAPLDLFTPGGLFYLNRKAAIDQKLHWITTASYADVVAYIGMIYRENYKSRCTCVSWNHPLKVLQMVALCLHSSGGVHSLCRLMCTDYRQFSSGAPDLLMLRAYYTIDVDSKSSQRKIFDRSDWDACLGPSWERFGVLEEEEKLFDDNEELGRSLSSAHTETKLSEVNEDKLNYRFVNSAETSVNGNNSISKVDVESNSIKSTTKKKVVYVGGKRKVFHIPNPSRRKKLKVNKTTVDDDACLDMSEKTYSLFNKKKTSTRKKQGEVINVEDDSDYFDSPLCAQQSAFEITEEESFHSEENNIDVEQGDTFSQRAVGTLNSSEDPLQPRVWSSLFNRLPVKCDQEDLVLPKNHQQGITASTQCEIEQQYEFECLLVEVKGPTDRLSDKQRVWCQAFSSYGVGVKVCRVDEGGGGIHVTADMD